MSFDRLASVELQLICQHCNWHSLLSLARCSRFTLQAASSDFAFAALPPVPFVLNQLPSPDAVQRSLLRFADIHLSWPQRDAAGPRVTVHQEREALWFRRLRSLDVSRWPMADSSLLSHECFPQLTALYAHALAFQPARLHSLRTFHLMDDSPPWTAGWYALLPRLPLLTDVRLVDSSLVHHDRGDILFVGECKSLLRLHMHHLCGARALPLLTSPTIAATLRHLSLSHAHELTGAKTRWNWIFGVLTQLQSLTLIDTQSTETIMRAAAKRGGPQLHSIRVASGFLLLMDRIASFLADAEFALALRHSSSSPPRAALAVEFRMPSQANFVRQFGGHPNTAVQWQRVHDRILALSSRFAKLHSHDSNAPPAVLHKAGRFILSVGTEFAL